MALTHRPARSLKTNGVGVIMGAPDYVPTSLSARGTETRDLGDLSIADMESALKAKLHKKPAQLETLRPNGGGAQTARGIFEENKTLIVEKQERAALARKVSIEEFEKLVAQDRQSMEGDKAREIHRRNAQRELALHYKEKIGNKETSRADQYHAKKSIGNDIKYFPFVEGETIDKKRMEKGMAQREEMRLFLLSQREAKPVRSDKLMEDAKSQHSIEYPIQPAMGIASPSSPSQATTSWRTEGGGSSEMNPHLSQHPKFLMKAQVHLSRRMYDDHVRQALEEKVRQTKAELEAAQKRKEQENQDWQDAILVSDALRSDKDTAKLVERRRNQDFLARQIEENKQHATKERRAKQAEAAPYWGPEEKRAQNPELHKQHCADLIRQMEVDQRRRLNSRGRRLRQEKALVANSLAEMSEDRQKEKVKWQEHKEALLSTWESQQKIKQAVSALEGM